MNMHIAARTFPVPGDDTLSPKGSPRSAMAQTSDGDLNAEPQKLITNVPAVRFSSADKELLRSGKYADAKIIANSKTYDVHKNVLCTRSKWFRKVLEGAFRVSFLLRYSPWH